MRKAVLENRLRRIERFGNTIRIFLSPKAYKTLQSIRATTRRTYHDILKVVLNVHKHQGEHFKGKIRRKENFRVLNVRLARETASDCLDLAWRREASRGWFLGFLIERFLKLVPKREITSVLDQQLDRLERLTGGTHVQRQKESTGQSHCPSRRSNRQGP